MDYGLSLTTPQEDQLLSDINSELSRHLEKGFSALDAGKVTEGQHCFSYSAGFRDAAAHVLLCIFGHAAHDNFIESESEDSFHDLLFAAMSKNDMATAQAISLATEYRNVPGGVV